ncbi:MAG: hypothetical protein ACOH2N_18255 [Devosia sp.]
MRASRKMMVLGHVGLLAGPSASAHSVNLPLLIDIGPHPVPLLQGGVTAVEARTSAHRLKWAASEHRWTVLNGVWSG